MTFIDVYAVLTVALVSQVARTSEIDSTVGVLFGASSVRIAVVCIGASHWDTGGGFLVVNLELEAFFTFAGRSQAIFSLNTVCCGQLAVVGDSQE